MEFKQKVGDKVRVKVAKPKWVKKGEYKEARPELVGLKGVIIDSKPIKGTPRYIVYLPKVKVSLISVGEWQLVKSGLFK